MVASNCRLWLVTVSVLAAAGCNGPLSPQAKRLWQGGQEAYNRGDDSATIRHMDEFLHQYPRSSWSDRAYHLRGLAKYRTKDYPGAKADFREAINRARSKTTRAKALKAMGNVAYTMNDTALAEQSYREALGLMERSEPGSDEIHYRLGCVLQRQGRWADADTQFDRLIYLFDGTALANRAKLRVHSKAWTIQAGAYKRKANADRAVASMRAENFQSVCRAQLWRGRPRFLVLVGRFPTYEQAVAALGGVKKLVSDAFVTPTR